MGRTDGWDAVARKFEMRNYELAVEQLRRLFARPSRRGRQLFEQSLLSKLRFDYSDLDAIASYPFSPDSIAWIGALYWENDFYREAIDAFRRAAEMGSELGLYELGHALLWLGEEREASEILAQVAGQGGRFAVRGKALLAYRAFQSGRQTAEDRQALNDAIRQIDESSHPDDRRLAEDYKRVLSMKWEEES